MMCVGEYEIKPFTHENLVEKNKCIHTNGRVKNGLMYLYEASQFNMIKTSTTYAK